MDGQRLTTGWLTVAQYAEQRGVSKQAVYRQIKRRKKEIDGLTRDVSGSLYLSPDAMQILDGYRTKSPAVIVQDSQAGEVERLKEEIERLKGELDDDRQALRHATEQLSKMADLAASQAAIEQQQKKLIEDKENALEKVSEISRDLEIEKAARETAESARKEAEEELQRIRSRGLWARIRNKE